MRRILKYVGIALVSIFLVSWIASGIVGTRIATAPRHRVIEPREQLGGRPVEDVSIRTEDGLMLSAWYVPNDSEYAVITLSGIGADRRQLSSTAEAYIELGFAALLPDLRGTGQSEGDLVSIGYYERKDLVASVRWLQDKGYTCVGAHGFSLGAATVCFSFQDRVDLGFAVIESGYDTMQNAVNRRLDIARMPHFIGWPYRVCFSWYVGADFRALSPIDYLPECMAPVLFLSGNNERVLTEGDTEAMFAACGSEKKRLHIFEGGKHAPSVSRFPDEARPVIREFLETEVGWKTKG